MSWLSSLWGLWVVTDFLPGFPAFDAESSSGRSPQEASPELETAARPTKPSSQSHLERDTVAPERQQRFAKALCRTLRRASLQTTQVKNLLRRKAQRSTVNCPLSFSPDVGSRTSGGQSEVEIYRSFLLSSFSLGTAWVELSSTLLPLPLQ